MTKFIQPSISSGCACCGVSRRQFVARSCAACLGAAGLASSPGLVSAASGEGKTRVRIIYALHGMKQPGPDWPNIGFDFAPVVERINRELAQRCPGFEFLVSTATGPEQAKKILDADKSAAIDGYLVYQLNCWNQVVQTFANLGKPVLYADFQYGGSGGFLVYTAGFLRAKNPNVGFVASSRIEDVAEAVKCFSLVKKGGSAADFVAATTRLRIERTPRSGASTVAPDDVKTLPIADCLARIKQSRILAIHGLQSGEASPLMGIPVTNVSYTELNDAWKAADKDACRAMADRWQATAQAITAVDRKTLETSAAMYFGQKALLKKYGANAITINCLGGFYGGHIHAYPCLGYHELNNSGLVGACECDLNSTATMVLMSTLTEGRAGYISDPILDTSKRQIVYAHCVASNRPFGPQGAANPFQILTHSEDRQGAAVRSLLPLGYMTTTVQFMSGPKVVAFHQGKTVENVIDDRACRTKLAAEPCGDIEKLFTQWDAFSWHRVTYYGDLKEQVLALADALKFKVIHEA
jgi:hypothetical protein